MARMVVGVAGGSMEKLIVASTVIGGAVALDFEVDVYLLLGGALAFRKGGEPPYDYPEFKDELLEGMSRSNVPDPFSLLTRLRTEGDVRIHVCSTAGKIWGAERLEDFRPLVDDIVGIGEYVLKAQEADVVQVL